MAENLSSLLEQIEQIRKEFADDIDKAQSVQDCEEIKLKYTSRKGLVQQLFPVLGRMQADERPKAGAELNALKTLVQEGLQAAMDSCAQTDGLQDDFDPTLPGKEPVLGHYHPIHQMMDEIKSVFKQMGFRVEEGFEIETDFHNFEALNIPPHHPSRDMHDTFYLSEDKVLRTHTSPVQIRTMENQRPPVRMIAPGKCFRKDTPDATHTPIFHQVEGLCVDKGVSFADLRGVVQAFAQKMFGSDAKVRFRASYFPFTEPSAEYDFSCPFCKQKGCRVCKNTGWIEISGAGMVNPAVFGFVDYDPEVYTGYAFGMGIERLAMLKYGVNDIRIFYENDKRFLEQF